MTFANSLSGGPRLLEVLPSDVAVEVGNGCAPFTEIVGGITASLTAPFPNGTYLVGVDIDPGTWRADTPNASCDWDRLRNLNGDDDIIANYLGSTPDEEQVAGEV